MKELVDSFLKTYNLEKGKIDWKKLKKSRKLVDYRKKIINKLLNDISKEVKCQERCKIISVGSENITSDLDITLTGEKAIEIAERFEKKFEDIFKDSPQKVFDTNVYATTFIFQPYVPNYKVIKTKEKTLYFIDNKNKDARDQHLFALIKIIENANSEQMKIIEQNIPKSLLRDSLLLLKELKNDEKDYIRELDKVKKLQKKFETAEGENRLKYGIQLKRQISVANFNSEEAYYTQGAFFHVVGKLQSGYKYLPITKHEYIDSILENTGFLLENYNKYGILKEKYIDRIEDAFKNIKIKFSKPVDTDINSILTTILEKIRF